MSLEHSIPPKETLPPCVVTPLPPQPPAPSSDPFLSVDVPFLDIPHTWDHTLHGLLCPALFSEHPMFGIRPRSGTCQSLAPFLAAFAIILTFKSLALKYSLLHLLSFTLLVEYFGSLFAVGLRG